jgi:hypothetical protein
MTFRLPGDEKAKLTALANKADCTLSDLAVRAVRGLLTKCDAIQHSTHKGRGRPSKAENAVFANTITAQPVLTIVKRGRGRPRKYPLLEQHTLLPV